MATYRWKTAASGDWTVAGNWDVGTFPSGGAAAVSLISGAYTVTIAATDPAIIVNTLTGAAGATLSLLGTLTFGGSSGGSFPVLTPGSNSGSLTIGSTGLLDGSGVVSLFTTVTNLGTISADSSTGQLDLAPLSLVNQGTIEATGGATLEVIAPAGTPNFTNNGLLLAKTASTLGISTDAFSNLSGGVLSGGRYEVDQPPGQTGATSAIVFFGSISATPFTTLDAPLVLNGAATAVFQDNYTNNSTLQIEQFLTGIGASGTLDLGSGRGFTATHALSNAGSLVLTGGTLDAPGLTELSGSAISGFGVITGAVSNAGSVLASGGTLDVQGSMSDGGTLATAPGATLDLPGGTYSGTINNAGTVEAGSGLVKLSGSLTGGGGLLIEGGTQINVETAQANATTTLELANPTSDPVTFNGAGGTLKLDTPSGYTGTITGFGSDAATGTTDTIDLVGIGADHASVVGSSLVATSGGTIVWSAPISGNYAGATFGTASDGGTGTLITLTGGHPAEDWQLTGPVWASRTLTWSFATGSYSTDSATPFDSAIAPNSPFAALVTQALAQWASVAGLNFVEVPDSQSVDIRIGFANLTGGVEIGQASVKSSGGTAANPEQNTMQPDAIVRLMDPAVHSLVNTNGTLIYSGTQTSFYQVALHEIGHALGLAHSTDPNANMYPSAGPGNATLDASDIAGVQAAFASASCFAGFTLIDTPDGPRPVERIEAGDYVTRASDGAAVRVRWSGSRTVRPEAHPRPHDMRPVRVRAGALGPALPRRDLILSPDHALFLDGVLIPVRHLIDGAFVVQERAAAITYHHLELEDAMGEAVHDVILAEGLPVESYLDTGGRDAFADNGAVAALVPDFAARIREAASCAEIVVTGAPVEAARARLRGDARRAA